MKGVEVTTSNGGALALVSKKNNLKFDKLTTYVLSSGDQLPAK